MEKHNGKKKISSDATATMFYRADQMIFTLSNLNTPFFKNLLQKEKCIKFPNCHHSQKYIMCIN